MVHGIWGVGKGVEAADHGWPNYAGATTVAGAVPCAGGLRRSPQSDKDGADEIELPALRALNALTATENPPCRPMMTRYAQFGSVFSVDFDDVILGIAKEYCAMAPVG